MFPKTKTKKPKKKPYWNAPELEQYKGQPCIICGRPGGPDHIRTKGAWGRDDDYNIWVLCVEHHTQRGMMGFMTFVRRFNLQKALLKKGWVQGGVNGDRWVYLEYENAKATK